MSAFYLCISHITYLPSLSQHKNMAARQAAPARRGTNNNPTHFLCIPLLRRQLAHNVLAFRANVCNINNAAPALPPSAVRPPGTMHITLGVMCLSQPEELARAVAVLKELRLRDLVPETRDVWLTLKGMEAMQDASHTGVLYAPPRDVEGQQEEGVLYAFCEAVRRRFIDAGAMEEETRRPFLLHATVVNTTHVKRTRGQKKGERLMLDARGLLEEYAEHVWLERHEVRTLAICKMGAKPKGEGGDEAYETVEEVAI